ncbi:histidine phosphatase family protein [Herbiconiux sp. KACC 21604]|uniref:histidine phosphatase family protein n=1 Tax=unclassified Herbiconiux TaxID=2618217 RepID=UPI0014919F5F|nr:histidine phosphatase family protein [Herbiconiux sp. SALV-R1]QJU54189.1 histidine phosphatase family protein [Herbiconiux sp. SALV-R1]WPO85243.1 histidine phosphatase family protein [Herbiconiux sp. KACC 21604]
MSLRLHLVRHGQTTLNAEERVQGWDDSELTEAGLAGVRETAEALRDVEFVAAYVSPLGRTVATADEILAHHPLVKPVLDDRLKELHFGSYESRPNASLLEVGDFATIGAGITAGTFEGFGGGEHSRDFVDRITQAFDDIVAAHPEGEVLVVSHGGTIQTFISRVAAYSGPPLANASVTVLERTADGWALGA